MANNDAIIIKGIRARGNHGLLQFERVQGQEFVVDAELHLNLAKAAKSDDVAHTVDYAAVADAIVEEIQGEAVDLIETLASRIATRCLRFKRVNEVIVTVHKPQAPLAVAFDDVAVRVVRKRK